jgi:hypothetical protein
VATRLQQVYCGATFGVLALMPSDKCNFGVNFFKRLYPPILRLIIAVIRTAIIVAAVICSTPGAQQDQDHPQVA